jgi:eukaryotic-like serine/threonine-protein kinase
MIGQNVGNYRITKLLGEGGMGKVYLAEHAGLRRQGAVKILHAELARSDRMVERFFNEARAANAIGHPGIVEVWDFGTLASGEPYLMMEFLRGESLAARLRRVGRLPLASALDIADQAATALGAAHDKGIVHRDLKPDNLFLVPDPERPGRDQIKILDFGIAKLAQRPEAGGGAITRTGAVLGTPLYMSPEQCRATRDVDHRSDIYSLGIILFEMLSGSPPFSSDSSGELVHMHIGVEPPALRSRSPDLAEELELVVGQMLQKDPAARLQSMAEFQRALTGGAARTVVLEQKVEPVPAALPSPPARWTTFADAASEVQNVPTMRQRRWWVIPGVVAGSAAATVLLAMLATGRDREPRPPPVPPVQEPIAVARPAPPPIAHEPVMIAVGITTVPEGARVVRERDGAMLGLTPLELSWPSGTGVETLRLERGGYRSETVVVSLDRDADLKLDLRPVAPSVRQAATPRRVPAPAPAKAAARPAAPAAKRAAPARKRGEPLKI